MKKKSKAIIKKTVKTFVHKPAVKTALPKFIILFTIAFVIRIIGPLQTYVYWNTTARHTANAVFIVVVAFLFMEISKRLDDAVKRIVHSIVFLFTTVIIYFIFQDRILATGISIAILTAMLVFIFQTPLLSFIGWVYIKIGGVYKEGDRISIASIKGDVVHINQIRTTVLEIGGEYAQADVPSGRLFTFPNALLLTTPVSNYTKYFSHIWVAVPFHLTYETDFDFTKNKLKTVVQKHIKIKEFKKLRDKSKKPAVTFNVKPFESWIELKVIFPVDPRNQSAVISAVTQDSLKMFSQYPDKVRFPMGRSR